MEDSQLVKLFLDRDEQALAEAQRQYGTYCRMIACNILRSDEDAEECVSDAMLKAWQSVPPAVPQSFKAYLGTLTRNLALDRYRRASSDKRRGDPLPIDELSDLAPSELNVENEAEGQLLRERLSEFVSSLDEESRRYFIQRYWYMLEISEIAEKNRVGKSKVKMRLLRARGRLREHLKKEGYEL